MDADVAAQKKALLGRVLRDRWTLDALLGAGGMATVYAATHRNGSRGAIKILHAEYATVPEVRTRLVREGYLVNRIKHRGVVRVLDDDVTEEGWPYLVMELLEGRTLKEEWIASDRKLPLGEALRIGEAVLDILAAAHAEGVVHRDVKPDNVFLTRDGEVRLLDFGIARFKEAAMEATQTGAMLGTPAFMAPEQALAHWDDVDARSDVFAVGATLWTVLTNRLIHVAKTVPEALIAAATRRARSFASIVPSAPPELAGIVDRALTFEREARWQSAAEMRDAIAALRARLETGAAGKALAIDATRADEVSVTPPPLPATSTEIMAPRPVAAASEAPPVAAASEAPPAPAGSEAPPPREDTGATPAAPSGLARRVMFGVVAIGSIAGAVYAGRWWATSNGDGASRAEPTSAPAQTDASERLAPPTAPTAPTTSATIRDDLPIASAKPQTSPVPSASQRRPPASAAPLPPFDSASANQQIREATRRAVISCGGHGPGTLGFILRFTHDGSSTVRLADPAQEGTRLANCARSVLLGIIVRPFEGPPVEMGATITAR